MLGKSRLFIKALIIFCSFNEVLSTKRGFFTFVAPGTIRSQSYFHVSISLSDFHKPCWFNISVQDGRVETYQLGSFKIHPKTTQLIKLHVPRLVTKYGYLILLGYRGIVSRDVAHLNFEHDSFSTFVQTNKAKYAPGELVQFRVILIDQLTRPARIDHGIFVLIYDGQNNLVKRISDVKLVQGVFKSEFRLSDLTVLGDWRIRVEMLGGLVGEKRFTVSNYDLPQFYLKIDTKSIVALSEEKVSLEISASYFYGEPVKGTLTLYVNNSYFYSEENLQIFKLKSEINGIASITLDFKNDLHFKTDHNQIQTSKRLCTLNIKAGVIDDLTEQRAWKEVEIDVHNQLPKVIVEVPRVFQSSGGNITFKVLVSILDFFDKPIADSETSIKIMTECVRNSEYGHEEFETFENEHLLKNRRNTLELSMENKNFSYCSLHAEYFGIKSPLEWITRNEDSLKMDILTESPEVNKVLEIKLRSTWPLGNFSYEIVSRGDIIQSKTIHVPNNQTTYILSLNVSYSMVPKITIFAHFILNGVFVGQLKDVHIKRDFQNSIQIKTDDETKPGAAVHVNVTTDEGSYIGLMALDQRVLKNFKYDLSEDLVYTKLRNYDSLSIDSSQFPGMSGGLVTFSNARNQVGAAIGKLHAALASAGFDNAEPFDKPSVELPRIRKLFSESWLYKDIERSSNGSFSLFETVPDTITSWAITGFSLNPKTGLTLTKNSTNLRVFQEFFISFDLPKSVKEGEIVEIPIYISNYMDRDTLASVSIESDSEDLEVTKHPEFFHNSTESYRVHISANGREEVIVFLKPHRSGHYNLIVKAISPIASDAVQKTFSVKSQGIPHTMSKTYLVHLPEESSEENEITIDIPENAVANSSRVEISVVGDIFRPLVRSLLKRARVPHGNSEENMRFIVSNWLVLKYFKVLNHTNPSLESKIRFNLELGYQNQLCFKHLDGSFGMFERTIKRTGGIWQTAFALWGLHQANNFIEIDPRIRERGLNYLRSKQLENGCFKSSRGIEEDTKLTALVLMVFLMDQDTKTEYNKVISKGLKYLYESLAHSSYLSGYVLLLGKHEKAEDYLRNLTFNYYSTSKQKLLKKPDTIQSHLETTAKSLASLLEVKAEPTANSLFNVIRGLIASGAGKSSKTHMIALDAMIVFVEDLNLNRKNLTITFKDDRNNSGDFQVNADNSQILQTLKLSDKSRRINVQSRGHGFAVIDVKYKYNLLPEYKSSSVFSTNINTRRRRPLSSIVVLKICVKVQGHNISGNNSTMIEVNLQSGYIFIKKSPDTVHSFVKEAKLTQLNGNRERIFIQLGNVDLNEICLKLKVFQKYKVFNAKPGWFIVHSQHEKDDKNVKIFTIN